MAHLRKQIRDAVKTTLTGLSTTGQRVFQQRFYPMQATALPGLLIYTNSETSELMTMTRPQKSQRELLLTVEGLAKANATLEDTLDAIAREVEEALGVDPTFGGLVKTSFLTGTELEFNADGENPVGAVRLTFAVRYITTATEVEITG